ncbi:MAG TPA: 3-hydroxyacyl-CoA dehydrogenase NAD-binding domain-containing protein [Dermatophilaceae bacterium]|nr:3-hydroxyacyl-CoA dehydrogenase NAD-binding domain-containing protein [Dermatophilaceae bacterium]
MPGAVAVIGAGTMGAGIARVAARAGHATYLLDSRPDVARAAAAESVRAVETPADLPPCEVVVEAVVEDAAVKSALLADLADLQPATTILATNTSSLDVTALAAGVPAPERVVGLHFFNPPTRMPLVEVVRGEQTADAVVRRCQELMRAWGKTPVTCASTPGFVVNRVARPFYGEAQRLVAAGVADPATVDQALRDAGFRMGPFELTDLIGQDVNLAVARSVWEQTGYDPRYEPTDWQRRLVATGRLGRKTGRGVFRYDAQGHPLDAHPDLGLAARLTAPGAPLVTNPVARTLAMLVNEAVDLVCRGEATPADVDTAMRLGAAYPRGPLEWGELLGRDAIRAQLAELDQAFPGGRYRASEAL